MPGVNLPVRYAWPEAVRHYVTTPRCNVSSASFRSTYPSYQSTHMYYHLVYSRHPGPHRPGKLEFYAKRFLTWSRTSHAKDV